MFKNYLLLTKPGIVMGNAITCIGGFCLAFTTPFAWSLFGLTLLGLSLIVAAGCVSNNYIDRIPDGKMERTKNRPLVKGKINPAQALFFATALLLGGSGILLLTVNLLSFVFSLLGFIIYLFFYSFSKYKTPHATLIGSVAGAIPPLVGYTAASQRIDMIGGILFLMIALWQMPHFYAIALFRMEEYSKASIPVMPLVRGLKITKMQMFLYICGFIGVALLLPLLQPMGKLYVASLLTLGCAWLWIAARGFKCTNEKLWARKMFVCSLAVVMGTCLVIPFCGL